MIRIFILLFVFSASVWGMEDEVQNWWSNSYSQEIQPRQRRIIKEELQEDCEYQINRYKSKQLLYINKRGFESAYFAIKIKEWEKTCEDSTR